MKKPESPIDLPCPNKECMAEEGSACTYSNGKPRRVHPARVSRLYRAQADWIKFREWASGEKIR